MAKDPAFLFYPNDYIGGTMGMTLEEKGAYIELLMMQFNIGHMAGHMIGQVVGQNWDKIKHKFVQDAKGLWYNERLELEKSKRKSFTDSRKNNLKGKNQYTKKEAHMDGHMTSHMEDVNEDRDIDIINTNKGVSDFLKKVNKDYPNIQKLKTPFTSEQLDKIIQGYPKDIIDDVLGSMENYSPLRKKYTSAYLTFLSWAKKRDSPKIGRNSKERIARTLDTNF